MTVASGNQVVRVGLIGLGRVGAHHLERISLRGDLQVAAACLTDGESLEAVHPLCRNVAAGVDDLLARDDVDVVLITGPLRLRCGLALASLAAGKHVALDSPPVLSSGEAHQLLVAARRLDRSVCVVSTRRGGLDFRSACEIASRGELGSIRSARIISWGRGVPPDANGKCSSPADSADEAFEFFAYQYIGQLFQLVRRPPAGVYARIPRNAETIAGATAFLITVFFPDGADAVIDVNLGSPRAFHSGWVLAGTEGVYQGGQLAIADPSGEMCETPVCVAEPPVFDVYAGMIAASRAPNGCVHSIEEALSVLRTIEAARESARFGETVRLTAL